jgi:hypothetical protein
MRQRRLRNLVLSKISARNEQGTKPPATNNSLRRQELAVISYHLQIFVNCPWAFQLLVKSGCPAASAVALIAIPRNWTQDNPNPLSCGRQHLVQFAKSLGERHQVAAESTCRRTQHDNPL